MYIYTIYVGHFKETSEAEEVKQSLNHKGCKALTYSKGDFFTLKVAESTNVMYIDQFMQTLCSNGFNPYCEIRKA